MTTKCPPITALVKFLATAKDGVELATQRHEHFKSCARCQAKLRSLQRLKNRKG